MKFAIKMYSDFQCPFCYIGKSILDTLCSDWDIEFTFKSFEIHLDVLKDGINAKEYFGENVFEEMLNDINAYGSKYGVHISQLDSLYNTNKALRVSEFAKEIGKSCEYNELMYKSILVDKINIGIDENLKRLANRVGISSQDVDKVLLNPKYQNILIENQNYCEKNQITSVPTFIINDRVKISGAQPPEVFIEVFEKFIKGEL